MKVTKFAVVHRPNVGGTMPDDCAFPANQRKASRSSLKHRTVLPGEALLLLPLKVDGWTTTNRRRSFPGGATLPPSRIYGTAQRSRSMMIPSLSLGQRAPNFDLQGVDGKSHSLNSFSDKPVLVIIFSCNHCPYVKAYEDRMVSIQRDYAGKGVQLVAINSNDEKAYPEDSFEEMVKRAKEKGFNFPYLRDEAQKVAEAYGAVCTPHVFAFDRGRTLRYRGRIDDSKDPSKVTSHDLRNAVDDMIRGAPVRVPDTRPFGCSIKWFTMKP